MRNQKSKGVSIWTREEEKRKEKKVEVKKKKGKGTRAGGRCPFPGISREVDRVREEGWAGLEKGGGERSSREWKRGYGALGR